MTTLVDSWEKDTEYLEIVGDLLANEQVQKLKEFGHHIYTNRLDHSLTVSYMSYKMAKKRNLDYVSCARAGLLHDFFLMQTKEVEALGRGSHMDVHPQLALENALKITELNEIEKDCILKHMFLVSRVGFPKYKESYIITLMDKVAAIQEVTGHLNKKAQKKIIRAIWRLRPAI